MFMTIGATSSPVDQVADGELEPIFTSLPPPVTVAISASSVANAASLPVENSIHYYNRTRPSTQIYHPPFIPSHPPSPSGHRIPPSPVPSFGGYSGFHGPAALPRPFIYSNTASPPMEYPRRRTPPLLPQLGRPHELFFSCPDPQLIYKISHSNRLLFQFGQSG